MKLLLINPPRKKIRVADFPPLGLSYIGAAAKQAGHDVQILDAASWTFDRLQQVVRCESPDVIGITCWTIERGQAFKTAHVAKRAAPKSVLIMGGPHATAFPEYMFLQAPTDFVVLGEGEETIKELLYTIENDEDALKVKGIVFKRNGKFCTTDPRPFIKDLDTIPLPLHEQFDYSKYNGLQDKDVKSAAIITSRGCPFRCIFCSSAVYWGKKHRKRSIENVLSEIDLLYNEYQIKSFLFFDDNLIIDRKRCITFCKEICNRRIEIIWATEGSVKVDQEMLKWMKRAGCYRIDFGVESGSPAILKNIKKPFTVEDTRNAFRLCREAGIKPNAYLIFGSPGETAQTVNETICLMREIQPHQRGGRPGIWILPSTEIYTLSKELGIISDQTWLETDETLYFTGEYSERELRAFPRQFNIGMSRDRGLTILLTELLRERIPLPIKKILRKYKRG